MSITNEDRYNLQTKANTVLGQKEGATLMELLPSVGWAQVATKRDLDHLEVKVGTRFAEQNAAFQTDLRKMQGTLLGAMLGLATLMTAILSVVIAIAT